MRLADRGLLETTWESDAPPGRPPRHLYRLTRAGLASATELAAESRLLGDAVSNARLAPTPP
jgi:DNA-binding PadR family transcriptional regulator